MLADQRSRLIQSADERDQVNEAKRPCEYVSRQPVIRAGQTACSVLPDVLTRGSG